jgi:hypothetical protein
MIKNLLNNNISKVPWENNNKINVNHSFMKRETFNNCIKKNILVKGSYEDYKNNENIKLQKINEKQQEIILNLNEQINYQNYIIENKNKELNNANELKKILQQCNIIIVDQKNKINKLKNKLNNLENLVKLINLQEKNEDKDNNLEIIDLESNEDYNMITIK